jgi:hypothetical protein
MSAFLVTKEHIDALVTAGLAEQLEWGENGRYRLSPETATAIGKMLWQANEASVRERYEERADEYWTEIAAIPEYVFEPTYDGPIVCRCSDGGEAGDDAPY